VEIAIARRTTDPVVGAQLLHPGSVTEPAEHEHGLGPGAERPRPLPGATAFAFRDEQRGQPENGSLAVYATLMRARGLI